MNIIIILCYITIAITSFSIGFATCFFNVKYIERTKIVEKEPEKEDNNDEKDKKMSKFSEYFETVIGYGGEQE